MEGVTKLIPEEIKLKIKKVFFTQDIRREVEILSQQNENFINNQNLLRENNTKKRNKSFK